MNKTEMRYIISFLEIYIELKEEDRIKFVELLDSINKEFKKEEPSDNKSKESKEVK